MAARNYTVGSDTNNISLALKVGTAAGWTAKVFKPVGSPSTGQWITIAQSTVVGTSAVFNTTSLGTAKDLRGVQICVEIIADFRNVDGIDPSALKTDNQALRKALFVDYVVSGGQDGTQEFDYDNDDVSFSTDGEIVRIDKYINFI